MMKLNLRRLAHLIFLALIAFGAPLAKADLFEWSFTVIPPDITGPPGSTIGWGYQITNLDTADWLLLDSLDADLFQFADPLSLFDFPILPPGGTVTQVYDTSNFLGLYQLTWDPAAPLGFVNSGTFIATGTFYIGDPFNGGVPFADDSKGAAYTATVGNLVPEPSSLWLLGSGLLLMALGLTVSNFRSTPARKIDYHAARLS